MAGSGEGQALEAQRGGEAPPRTRGGRRQPLCAAAAEGESVRVTGASTAEALLVDGEGLLEADEGLLVPCAVEVADALVKQRRSHLQRAGWRDLGP